MKDALRSFSLHKTLNDIQATQQNCKQFEEISNSKERVKGEKRGKKNKIKYVYIQIYKLFKKNSYLICIRLEWSPLVVKVPL